MKYTLVKTDGRHSYHEQFEYYIRFGKSMVSHQGPLMFTRAHKWFSEMYGWSAEIRLWNEIKKWSNVPMMSIKGGFVKNPLNPDLLPEECNLNWSWSNGMEDLRIYVKSSKELSFFQLKFSVDQ